ncbi:MAG: hypothetical protein GC191_15800 [Azospirillum sp.]|nr:hypothetical protein [Azospirillum sp.]
MLVILLAPAALFLLPTTILFGIGLIPTLVAFLTDRNADKTASITVGAINFCGIAPFAFDLWQNHNSVVGALHIFADPLAWLIMYGAAAIGWGIFYGIPPAIANFEVMRAERQIGALLETRVELIREWGHEITQDDDAEFPRLD